MSVRDVSLKMRVECSVANVDARTPRQVDARSHGAAGAAPSACPLIVGTERVETRLPSEEVQDVR